MGIPIKEKVYGYIAEKYGAAAEYPWRRYPEYAVFRHEDNKKWFALFMEIPKAKLIPGGGGYVSVVNVKLGDLLLRDLLIQQEGYFPGYHIRAGDWITVLLDGTVTFEAVCGLIDTSYMATASKKKKNIIRQPKEWIIPANPKYFDIVKAFEKAEVIDWKQGPGVRSGDTVYMYVAAPVSAILYKCEVTESDIPYHYQDNSLTIKKVMKIRLLKRYSPDRFTFGVLKSEYGIFAVRGPRGVPNSLSADLNR